MNFKNGSQLLALVEQKITSKGGPFDIASSICHVGRGPPLGAMRYHEVISIIVYAEDDQVQVVQWRLSAPLSGVLKFFAPLRAYPRAPESAGCGTVVVARVSPSCRHGTEQRRLIARPPG